MTIGINQRTAPIRFGFLIKPESQQRFLRATEIAFSIWGGLYSPILPLYRRFSKAFRNEFATSISVKDFYINTLNNFDPDILIYDDDLDLAFIKEISGDRKLFGANGFLEILIQGDINYGVDITQIVSSVIDSDFKYVRRDKKRIMIPKINDEDAFLKIFIGSINKNIEERILRQENSENIFYTPSVNIDTLDLNDFSKNIDIIDLNIKWIKLSTLRTWSRGYGVYFININRLTDLVNFWNLRALGWTIIPIPTNNLDHSFFINRLVYFSTWYKSKPNHSQFITTLLSYSVTSDTRIRISQLLDKIQQKVESDIKFAYQSWIPRFWEKKDSSVSDSAQSAIQYIETHLEHVEIKDKHVEFLAHNLPFEIKSNIFNEAYYKTSLGFSYYSDFEDYAGLIYGIETIDWIRLTNCVSDNWRLSKSGLDYLVHRKNENIFFQIPQSYNFFKTYFSKKSYILRETANGHLANEVLKNIGGINGTYFIKNLSYLKIIDLFENGQVVEYSTLVGQIKRYIQLDNPSTHDFIKELVGNKIIEIGAKIQCPVCNQRTFYLPKELDIKITCAVCRNEFGLPTHNPAGIIWSYRGIGPFSKNNKVSGLMSVFLTLKLFNVEFAGSSGNMSSLIGFELSKHKLANNEIDLVVLVNERKEEINPPDLFFCECKTFKDFTKDDIERMKKIGEDFPSSILTFATLKDSLNENEKKLLKGLVKYFRKGKGSRPLNSILILTSKELLSENNFDFFIEYKDQIKPYHRFNDWIGNLCELTLKKNLSIETWGSILSRIYEKEMKSRQRILTKNLNPN